MTRLLIVALSTAVFGCASAGPALDRRGSASPTFSSTRLEPVEQPPSAPPEPTSNLTLRDAVALALVGNPELSEYSWQLRADEARIVQSGLRPNPEASVFVEDVIGTGRFRDGSETQVTLELTQAVELGGQRAARLAAASGLRDVSRRDYELKRVDVLAQTARRFIDLLAAEYVLELARTNLKLDEKTLDATAERVRSGAGFALDERKARIEVARGRIAAEHAEHEVSSARRELAAAWGSTAPRFAGVEGRLFARKAVPSYDQVAARLPAAPEMLRNRSEQQLREAEVRLADTKRIPTPTIGVGIRRLEAFDDESMVFGVAVPLPASDRNQGNRAEARALLAKSTESRRAIEVRLRTLLFSLHQELRHASAALDSLEEVILPQADDMMALSRNGFAEGRFSYLELADAQRTLTAVKRERIETAASYHRLVLEIERLTGEPIDAVSTHEGAVTP